MPARATELHPATLWQYARSGPWLRGLAGATCAAILCSAAGMWQWERRQDRVARNQLVLDNYDAPPQTLKQALATPEFPTAKTWQRVKVTGEYVAGGQLLVRSRPLNGRPGSYALTPFRTEHGVMLYINRGWLPIDEPAPAAPTGQMTITPHLRPAEPQDGRTPPPGHIFRIIPQDLSPDLPAFEKNPTQGSVVSSAFGQLGTDEPITANAAKPNLLKRLPKPEISEGSHLSYTFQWFIFALGCFGAWFLALRRSFQDTAVGQTSTADKSVPAVGGRPDKTQHRTRANRRTRKRDDDMDAEDTAIDAQLGHGIHPKH